MGALSTASVGAGCLLAFILGGAPAPLRAPTDTETDEVYRLVLVSPPDDPLATAAQEALGELPVEFSAEEVVAPGRRTLPEQLAAVSEVANMTGANLVAWFELDEAGHLYLYVSEAEGGGTFVREVDSADPQRAAQMLRDLVQETLAGGRLGVAPAQAETLPAQESVEPEPAPEPEPEPAPTVAVPRAETESAPVRRRPRVVVDLGAAYGLEGFSPQRSLGHAIVVGPDLWFGAHVMAALRFRGTLPTTVTGQGVELRLFRYPVELSIRGVARLGRVDLGGGIVFVLEVLERRARPTFAGVEITPASPWVRGALGPVLQVGWQAHSRVRLWIDVGADVHLLPVEHVVTGGDEPLLAPFPVRPRAQLGVSVALNPPKAKPRVSPRSRAVHSGS